MLIDLFKPTVIIELSSLRSVNQIGKIMKDMNIARGYAYSILHNTTVLKFGESSHQNGMWGERLRRQVSNIPGWKTVPRSPSGKDILNVIFDYEKVFKATVSKENVSVHIYDAAPLEPYYPNEPSRVAESQLLTQYESIHGCLPIGNIKDTRKGGHSTTFTDLFDPD